MRSYQTEVEYLKQRIETLRLEMRLQKDESDKKVCYLMDELNSSNLLSAISPTMSSSNHFENVRIETTHNSAYQNHANHKHVSSNEDSAIDMNSIHSQSQHTVVTPAVFISHAEYATTKTVTIPTHENELSTIYCIESDNASEEYPVIVNTGIMSSTKALEVKFYQMVDFIVEKLKNEVQREQEEVAKLKSKKEQHDRDEETPAAELYEKSNASAAKMAARPGESVSQSGAYNYEKIAHEIFIKLNAQLEQIKSEKQGIENQLYSIMSEMKRNQVDNSTLTSRYETQLKQLSEQLDNARGEKIKIENHLSEIKSELKGYQSENAFLAGKYEQQVKSLNERLDQSNQEKASIEKKLETILSELKQYQNEIVLSKKLSSSCQSVNEQMATNEKNSIEVKLSAILNELKTYQNENVNLTNRYETQLKSLSEQLERAKVEKASLENEMYKILQEVKSGQSDLASNSKQCDVLNSKLEQTKNEKSDVEKQLLQLFNDLKQYQKDNIWLTDKYEQQVKNLNEQLQLFQVL